MTEGHMKSVETVHAWNTHIACMTSEKFPFVSGFFLLTQRKQSYW